MSLSGYTANFFHYLIPAETQHLTQPDPHMHSAYRDHLQPASSATRVDPRALQNPVLHEAEGRQHWQEPDSQGNRGESRLL
jgi:hypothetical protein